MLVALAEDWIPESLRDRYKPIDSESRVVFLADWISLGRGRFISMGDIVASIGFSFVFLGIVL